MKATDPLPAAVERVLDRGSFCHVATATRHGPHVTPMVYALTAGRLWVTTSRGSVKARAWRHDDRVAGLVRDGDRAVTFTGRVRTFDVLDSDTWVRALRESPALALASARFTRKNARFFAGYAVDARRVPLAWTPPGRVFAELSVERIALVGDGDVVEEWGEWPRAVVSRERFRAARAGEDPLGGLPTDVRGSLGPNGRGVLGIEGGAGMVVLPAAWAVHGSGLYAALPERVFAIADPHEGVLRAALGIDRPSWWRASEMVGAMMRGLADVFAVDRLASGGRSAADVVRATAADPLGASLVRISPRRVVWWRGWSSGTVMVA